MKKLLQNSVSFLTLSSAAILPSMVYAAPPKLEDAGAIFERVFDLILPIGGLIAVAMIIFGGYMWMMAAGDPGKIKQAQGTLTWSVFGLIFLAVIKFILQGVFDFLGS